MLLLYYLTIEKLELYQQLSLLNAEQTDNTMLGSKYNREEKYAKMGFKGYVNVHAFSFKTG
jgi:hypothetical protein